MYWLFFSYLIPPVICILSKAFKGVFAIKQSNQKKRVFTKEVAHDLLDERKSRMIPNYYIHPRSIIS